jgi:hypothetical protein
MSARPLASVSLDLDDLWAYLRTHGDPGWQALPSYLGTFVPLALDALDALGLRITFFLVGQDAALERNHAALRRIVERGHEVGNHSFLHEQWMHLRPRQRIRDEIAEAAAAIAAATGERPAGYRGPGFAWNADVLDVLEEAGYLYDASSLPTFLGPLARLYYFRRSRLDTEELRQRRDLFGSFAAGRRPNRPHLWDLGAGRRLLEIPVTTFPLLRTPFHLSYLLYLARYSTRLMSAYLDAALRLCLRSGIEPSFLVHPLDLLGAEHAPGLAFFPGMDVSSARKRQVFEAVLGELGRRFRLVALGAHARELLGRPLPLRDARGERA